MYPRFKVRVCNTKVKKTWAYGPVASINYSKLKTGNSKKPSKSSVVFFQLRLKIGYQKFPFHVSTSSLLDILKNTMVLESLVGGGCLGEMPEYVYVNSFFLIIYKSELPTTAFL